MRVGLIVAEASGDKLAASILAVLKQQFPALIVEGILGPACEALGFRSWFPMERLSVMGIIEPLKRLPELLRMRRQCIQRFLQNPPDCFIGVDAPDFNLQIEKILKQNAITTVHVASPTVWAWRKGRIKTIKKAVSLMLPLFPFEETFYQQHNVPVKCIGHPLADSIPLEVDTGATKQALGLQDKTVIALLPGSREAELRFMLPVYLQAAALVHEKLSNVHFVVPVVSEQHAQKTAELIRQLNLTALPVTVQPKAMATLLPAADAVLVTSGTATVEVMLMKKPMVIAYKTDAITFAIGKWLVKLDHIGMPNILAKRDLVPELIQHDATPERCAAALLDLLNANHNQTTALHSSFVELHQQLKQNAATKAAEAIRFVIARHY